MIRHARAATIGAVRIECAFDPEIGGGSNTRSADRAIAALAATQHGVVSRAQLLELGLGARAIDHRVARGALHVIHRGAYAVGHPALKREGAWIAAVLAVGPGAVLSHRSAAALWAIRDSARGDIDVTAAAQRRRPGIDSHRVRLAPDEITTERGIPVTTPARTLLDLAEHLTAQQLERAIQEAEYRRLTSPVSLDALLARHPGRRGTTALKEILERKRLGHDITKSELETRFLALLDAHGLPRPWTNRQIGPFEVDAVWPSVRLVVELDSRQAHQTTTAFERDRARDRHLQVRGWRVLRITWRGLHDDADEIAAGLRTLLSG